MTMTPQQKADRLAMIKEIAERNTLKRKSTFNTLKRKSKQSLQDVGSIKTKRVSNVVREPVQGENINYWTDASQYADEYYGETYRATTKYDNDWGDY